MNIDFSQMQAMLGEAKKNYEAMRVKMAATIVEGNAGAGMVQVRMNGEKQIIEVKLDPEVVKSDPEMLPDLIRAAVNDAGRRVDDRMKDELGGLMGGMGGLGGLGGLL